jgi:hypothetical protein
MYGFTDNYIKVAVPYREDWVNTLRTIYLFEFSTFGYVKGEAAAAMSLST